MVTVVYCTRKSNPEHKEHLIKMSGLANKLEVIEIINNGESLTSAYNRGLKMATNNIVVFCHDDISIETKQWGNKLLKLFNRNPEYGILGVAGTKYMPTSGKWWENPRKMYGRVAHTHEGKTWLSTYSDDLGQTIEETIIVDGVFFAIDKTKIKNDFNEDVKGFHFYDVNFCFENHINGVKVGVTTLIRVNHKSIGMTNDEWESNRIQFSENFKDKLPINVKRTIHKNQRFKINLCSLSFKKESIKDKILAEIAIGFKKLGHDVTITAVLTPEMNKMVQAHSVRTCPIQEPPGFKLGDGKWMLNTKEGVVPSSEKQIYKIKDVNFDIIHVFNDELIDHFVHLYPNNLVVNTQYLNDLFITNTKNEKVVKTINLNIDLNEIKKIETIKKIISDYIEIL